MSNIWSVDFCDNFLVAIQRWCLEVFMIMVISQLFIILFTLYSASIAQILLVLNSCSFINFRKAPNLEIESKN
jgi:hypothetical protein